MKPNPKNSPRSEVDQAYAQAFARLSTALAKATTPADLTEAEKTRIWVFRLWGPPPNPLKP